MEHRTSIQRQPKVSYTKPILLGAGIALLVISAFVFGVDAPAPEWGKYWRIRPLVVTPLAGAVGGALFSLLQHQRNRGLNQLLATIIGLVVYMVSLWLGIVLGLDGTLWD